MQTAILSSKGQITLPARIRKRLGLRPNDRIALIVRGEEIVLKPLKGTIRDLRGVLEPKSTPENFDHIRRQVKGDMTQKQD